MGILPFSELSSCDAETDVKRAMLPVLTGKAAAGLTTGPVLLVLLSTLKRDFSRAFKRSRVTISTKRFTAFFLSLVPCRTWTESISFASCLRGSSCLSCPDFFQTSPPEA